MADIKYLVELDASGAIKSIKDFDDSVDKVAKTSDNTEKSTKSLWSQVALGQFAYDAAKKAGRFFVDFLKDSITEAGNAEKADKSLASALEITSRPVKALAEHFKTFSEAMQKATTFEDDQVTMAQTLLVQLTNLDRDGIDRATKGAIGLATVMGMDLQSAAMVVEKAVNGNAGALGRYGIQIDGTKDKEAQRAEVLGKLEKFYARATAETDTYSGRVAQLKNSYQDIQEKVGEYITKNTKLVSVLKDVVILMNILTGSEVDLAVQDKKLADNHKQMTELLYRAGMAAGLQYNAITQLIAAHNGDVHATASWIARGKEGLTLQHALKEAQLARLAALKKTTEAELAGTEGTITTTTAIVKQKKEVERIAVGYSDLTKLIKANAAQLLMNVPPLEKNAKAWEIVGTKAKKSFTEIAQGINEMGDKIVAVGDKIVGTFMTAFDLITAASQQGYTNRQIQLDNDYKIQMDKLNKLKEAKLITEDEYNAGVEKLDKAQNEKTKKLKREMAESQKKTAIIQAIISTYQAVAQTFSTLGFPWGVIPAAAMLKLGMDNVSRIRQQPIPLAKGAIFKNPANLTSSSTGQEYQVAEAGEAEIISSPKRLREAIGGGKGSRGDIYLSFPIYLAGQKLQEVLIKLVQDASQTGKLQIAAKAVT